MTGITWELYIPTFSPADGKRAGAWMTEFKGQWKEENGKDSRPHVTIVMNFSRPTSDTPALLTYDEVETFLHEFGTCSARITFRRHLRFAFRDKRISRFWQLPSQFNENYLSEKEFLTALQSTTKPVKKFRSNW